MFFDEPEDQTMTPPTEGDETEKPEETEKSEDM